MKSPQDNSRSAPPVRKIDKVDRFKSVREKISRIKTRFAKNSKLKLPLNKRKLMIVAGIVLTISVTFVFWQTRGNSEEKKIQGSNEIVTYSTDSPDEAPITKENYEWVGDDSDPKYLKISSIGAEGFIQKVGFDQNKQVAVPTNIYLMGWFVNSAKPGEPGLSVIDGHLDGRVKGGVFRDLSKLGKGSEFELELGNGNVLKYKVMDVVKISVKDATKVLFSQRSTIVSQLNLITCGGTFDEKVMSYDERTIVVSELIKSL